MKDIFYKKISIPIGDAVGVFSENGVVSFEFLDKDKIKCEEGENRWSELLEDEMRRYFAGELMEFSVPLDVRMGTKFQREVWEILKRIPYGHTISYKEEAQMYGDGRYARAVASANRVNPVAIIVPCHRVVGSGGKMGGYFWGVEMKHKLLELEKRVLKVSF